MLPLYGGVTRSRATVEGYLAEQQQRGGPNTGCVQTYVQCSREGVVEAVDTQLLSRDRGELSFVPSTALENAVIDGVTRYLGLLGRISVLPPFFVMLSLLGIAGYRLSIPAGLSDVQFRQSRLLLPELALQAADGEPALLLRPLFDSLWNAWGYTECGNYDGSGRMRA